MSSNLLRMRLPLVALAAILVGQLIALRNGFEDDAFISFRYLDNWLNGVGLIFNQGEAVEGYTNFFWIVLLAPLRYLGLSPEVASYGLSLLFLFVLLYSVFRIATLLADGDEQAGLLALLFSVCALPLVRWTGSGMEAICFTALITLATLTLVERSGHSSRSSLLFGLATLTRPEGLAIAGLFFGAFLWEAIRERDQARRFIGSLLVFLAFPILHLAFRLHYYGDWVPNTYYAKLSGEILPLLQQGAAYLWGFMTSGGWLVSLPAVLILISPARNRWLHWALVAEVLFIFLYVIRVGGDYMPFFRFLVPAIPVLAILSGVGFCRLADRGFSFPAVVKLVAVTMAFGQIWLGYSSYHYQAHLRIIQTNSERELVAAWIQNAEPKIETIAVNAAGIIPYRTGMYTVDMLGLNDLHIARVKVSQPHQTQAFVGHYKYDGKYVCERKPDVVITSSGALRHARNSEEAIAQAALNTFASDRDFLSVCGLQYQPHAEQVDAGKFVVVYRRLEAALAESPPSPLDDARTWYVWGVRLLQTARLEEARRAFKEALIRDPDNSVIMTSLAYTYFDQRRFQQAKTLFESVLEGAPDYHDALYGLALSYEKSGRTEQAIHLWERYLQQAPASPWKGRAENHLRILQARQ